MNNCFEKQILQNLSANSADLKSNFRKTKNTLKNKKPKTNEIMLAKVPGKKGK